MTHLTKIRIATGASVLFVAATAAFLVSAPPNGSSAKLGSAGAPITYRQTIYTPRQLSAKVPLSAASPLFIQATAVQNSENGSGQEVGKGAPSGKPTPEEDSVAQETHEILGGRERNV